MEKRRETYLLEISAFFYAGNLFAGLLLENTLPGNGSALLFLLSVLPVFLLLPLCCGRNLPRNGLLFLLFFCLGTSGHFLHAGIGSAGKERMLEDGRRYLLRGTVERTGADRRGRPCAEIRLAGEKTTLYRLPEDSEPQPGTRIEASVRAVEIRNFTEDFDYRKYMHRRGFYCSCFPLPGTEIRFTPPERIPPEFLPAALRERYAGYLRRLLEERCSESTVAFSLALSSGDRRYITDEQNEAFRKSGAMHLLALSGMHLGILYSCLSFALSLFGNYTAVKKTRSVLILLLLWAYSVFTGLGVSILRAVLMITVYEIGTLLGRRKDGRNALAASILLIGSFSAPSLGEIGFQLSCGAMLGIFLVYPVFRQILPVSNPVLKWIWNAATFSLSCQVITTPLIMIHFGTYSLFSLLTNLLCSPLTTLIMSILPVVLLFSSLPVVGNLSQDLLNLLTEMLIGINQIIADL